MLLGGGNALLTAGATSSISVDGPGLAGSTTIQKNFLFLVYVSPKVSGPGRPLGFCLWASW